MLGLFLLLPLSVSAQALLPAEHKIKTGLIYSFLKYTDWPVSTPGQPLVVCQFGGDAFGGQLQALDKRSVNLRPIEVRRVEEASVAATQCHVVVVVGEVWDRLRTALQGKQILIVGEGAQFLEEGGMLAFDRAADRITVTLNPHAVENTRLILQPRLLKLITLSEGN